MRDSDEPQSSNPMDPLDGLPGLSLFPRTFRDFKNASNFNYPDDLESIHGCMKSMALRSPRKHLEQAKSIVAGNSELLNSVATFLASENKIEDVVATKVNENARERRPGLGRRRAKFSLKPDSSQPSVNLEPTLDIDHLQDPEEFFLAHEKFENARKELLLLRGGSMADLNDVNTSKTERRRRPGILGKSYKHHFSSMLPEIDLSFMSSQGTSGQDILSPLNYTSQPEAADPNVELQEAEITGSITETENRVDGLLDELLSDKCENLDGEGLLSFLQERLQVKPLDLDKLCLPDFHDVRKTDFVNLEKISRKPRNALSDIQNLEKGIFRSGKTPVKLKQVVESPVLSLTSPTPPKSPFALVSLLRKSILRSDLRSDPFSALDLSPARKSASVELVEQSDQHVQKKFGVSGELKSLRTEIGGIEIDDVGSQEMVAGESITPCEKSTNDNSGRPRVVIDVLSNGSNGEKYTKGSRTVDGRAVEYNDSLIKIDTDVWTNGPNEMEEGDIMLNTCADVRANKHSEIEVGDMLQEAVSSGDVNCGDSSRPYAEFQTERPHEMEKTVIQTNVEDMAHDAQPDTSIGQPSMENLGGNQSHQDHLRPSTVEPHVVDGSCETSDAIPEQHIKEPSRVSLNERSPAKRPQRSKRKTLSHRQSLAGCGMSWEAGVRRSKRVKMRPLEYWKGERFLYGRVHESLTTVIGVKYLSPAKGTDGKPSMKVKSYVSDEYKELVELASLH